MKIVYLSHARVPSRTANSLNVMKMCEAFAQNGHDVILFVPRRSNAEPGVKDPFAFYGVEPCFGLKRFPRKKKGLRGLLHHTVVSTLIRLRRPDLLFGRDHSLRYDLDEFGLPVVIDAHKLVDDAANRRRLPKLIQSGRLRRLVTTTDVLAGDYAREFGIPRDRIVVARNAADEPGSIEALDLPPPERLRVGYLGHLYPGKGMERIAEMAPRCPWASFHVVGGAESDLADWERKMEGCENLFFHGYRPHAETGRYRQSMDVLLAPYQLEITSESGGTIDARSMSPIKIFEYMAAGKAILASDLPAIREILTDRVNARLCPADDTTSWVDALEELRDQPTLREALGQAAREAFRANHTWRARAKTMLDGIEA
ncbi:MAG: glycosyltransferase family 4 protein [Deltaproteobacteria bacterium]|nr:glycosyltransferase family 4 protein [Deltaproteobacteria bacterium]